MVHYLSDDGKANYAIDALNNRTFTYDTLRELRHLIMEADAGQIARAGSAGGRRRRRRRRRRPEEEEEEQQQGRRARRTAASGARRGS